MLYQKLFLSQSLPTLGIVHTNFRLIWTTLGTTPIVTTSTVSNMLQMTILLFQMVKLWGIFNDQYFKTDQAKQNHTWTKISTASDTLCVKVSSKSVLSTRRYCIVNVPYQSGQKRWEVTCRVKIDHQTAENTQKTYMGRIKDKCQAYGTHSRDLSRHFLYFPKWNTSLLACLQGVGGGGGSLAEWKLTP